MVYCRLSPGCLLVFIRTKILSAAVIFSGKRITGQAQYHFLSGYTAKVAGTERGVTEPQATFSACFGAAFLPLHPTKYADLLQKKLQKYGIDHCLEHAFCYIKIFASGTKVFLVNTGWSGGSYGSGKRLSLKVTRQCIDAILDGSINKAHFYKDPVFGFDVPKKLGSLSAEVLCPRAGWQDKTKYDETARKLADSFKENFKQFVRSGFTDYSSYGPN
jgi:phosphoenolpyruvate carboxykinase (ATP)